MVRHAQEQKDPITGGLEDRQQKLMKTYLQCSLDEKLIAQLHRKIVDLHGKLLNNYRSLQVQLRGVVGKPGLLRLKRRGDLILKGKKKIQTTTECVSPNRSTRQHAINSETSPNSLARVLQMRFQHQAQA
jgi:hypothetical protein